MEIPFRIGNVELRKSATLAWRGNKSKDYYDIVLWYPNGYYGKEEEFDYDEQRCMYKARGEFAYYIDPACFKHPESCYSIAHLVPDSRFDEPHDIKSVGPRPFNLSAQDMADYLAVVKYSYEHWKELYSDDSEYLVN